MFMKIVKNVVDAVSDPIPVVQPLIIHAVNSTELDCSTKLKDSMRGEVACTGLHGANRLASNSLLEAVVMAHRGAEAVCIFLESRKKSKNSLPGWVDGDVPASDERAVLSHNLDELKHHVGLCGYCKIYQEIERAQSRLRNLERN